MRRRERENLKKRLFINIFYNHWFLIEILVIIECEFNVYSLKKKTIFPVGCFQKSRLTSTIMQQLVSSQNCDVIWTGLTGVPAVWSMWWRNSVFLHALLSCYASVQ